MTERICRTCAGTTKAPGHAAHYKVGLRNCVWLASHIFVGPRHTCEKWQQAKQANA